jgi:hypothetical protein
MFGRIGHESHGVLQEDYRFKANRRGPGGILLSMRAGSGGIHTASRF